MEGRGLVFCFRWKGLADCYTYAPFIQCKTLLLQVQHRHQSIACDPSRRCKTGINIAWLGTDSLKAAFTSGPQIQRLNSLSIVSLYYTVMNYVTNAVRGEGRGGRKGGWGRGRCSGGNQFHPGCIPACIRPPSLLLTNFPPYMQINSTAGGIASQWSTASGESKQQNIDQGGGFGRRRQLIGVEELRRHGLHVFPPAPHYEGVEGLDKGKDWSQAHAMT